MKRGIIIIGLGHEFYGRMAHNLAASIKAAELTMPVALVHDESALKLLHHFNLEKTFDILIPTNEFADGNYLKAKTHLFDLSPFEETIYLDADMIWLKKKPSELFDELKDCSFTMINEGVIYFENPLEIAGAYRPWADVNEIKKEYGLQTGLMYNQRSELIYFRDTLANKVFFDKAKEIFSNPKVKPVEFAGSVPDELAFNIAGALLKHYPHQVGYRPVFWQHINPRRIVGIPEVMETYYSYSMGGNRALEVMKRNYNLLAEHCFRKINLLYPWKFMDKRRYLPQRKLI